MLLHCDCTAASYTPFFKECWDRKSATEHAYSFSGDDNGGGQLLDLPNKSLTERMKMRPPAALPKRLIPSTMVKSSTSNRYKSGYFVE